MQSWAMEPCRVDQTIESPLQPHRSTRPNSLTISPSINQSPLAYTMKPSFDVYSTDTLRRNNQPNPLKPAVVNHLTPSSGASPGVIQSELDIDTLNRKSSSKSTTSAKVKDETGLTSRRTDHDRDYHKPRQRDIATRDRESTAAGIGSSTKRRGANLRSRPEDSLEIYESLSESPV